MTSNDSLELLNNYNWASTQEDLSSGFATSKDTNQPLISDFVVRLLEVSLYLNFLQVKFQFSS